MELPIDALYSIVETTELKIEQDENGRLSYDEINKFCWTYIDKDGKLNTDSSYYSSEYIQFLADYYQDDQYIPMAIIMYLLESIILYLPINVPSKIILESLLSRDLIPEKHINKSLKILNDTSFIKEYFATREITLLDVSYIAYNGLYTKFLSDRKMLTNDICLEILTKDDLNYNLEVCKILLDNLQYTNQEYINLLCQIWRENNNYNNDLTNYMVDKYGYKGIYVDYKIIDRNKLYKSVNKYLQAVDDLAEILEIIVIFPADKIFGHLNISMSDYMTGYYVDYEGRAIRSIKINTLMEFLIFAKKFSMAFQLNELMPENNHHKGMWYFYKKQIFDEYELYCQTYCMRQVKSANNLL